MKIFIPTNFVYLFIYLFIFQDLRDNIHDRENLEREHKTTRPRKRGRMNDSWATMGTVAGLLVVDQPAGDSVQISWTSHRQRIRRASSNRVD